MAIQNDNPNAHDKLYQTKVHQEHYQDMTLQKLIALHLTAMSIHS